MEVNLYSRTRGVNRFKGLAATMRMLAEHGVRVPGADELCAWVEKAPKLSNPALEEAVAAGGGAGLQKALEWSRAVNAAIAAMGDNSRPFPGCREALAADPCADGHRRCFQRQQRGFGGRMDAATALSSIWTSFWARTQAPRRPAFRRFLPRAMRPGHVLMVGDALGDLAAAQHADALFYPILVGKEKTSWERLVSEALPRFLAGTFAGAYQEQLLAEQREILK